MTAAKYKKESTPEVKPCLNGQNGKIFSWFHHSQIAGVINHRVTNSTQTREEVNCHSSIITINGVFWQVGNLDLFNDCIHGIPERYIVFSFLQFENFHQKLNNLWQI